VSTRSTSRSFASVARAAFVLALAAAAAACAGSGAVPSSPHETERNEILMLDGRILDWRREMGLEPTPRENWVQIFYDSPDKHVAEASQLPVPELCRDTCTLADYICDASGNICRIADDLKDDDWARRKCANAKASCVEARQKCTTCSRRAEPTPAQK
jgi:hypothetical protein